MSPPEDNPADEHFDREEYEAAMGVRCYPRADGAQAATCFDERPNDWESWCDWCQDNGTA